MLNIPLRRGPKALAGRRPALPNLNKDQQTLARFDPAGPEPVACLLVAANRDLGRDLPGVLVAVRKRAFLAAPGCTLRGEVLPAMNGLICPSNAGKAGLSTAATAASHRQGRSPRWITRVMRMVSTRFLKAREQRFFAAGNTGEVLKHVEPYSDGIFPRPRIIRARWNHFAQEHAVAYAKPVPERHVRAFARCAEARPEQDEKRRESRAR